MVRMDMNDEAGLGGDLAAKVGFACDLRFVLSITVP